MMAIWRLVASSSSRTTTGISWSGTRCAARQRRSPAMISIAVGGAGGGADEDGLQHALLADGGGEALQILLGEPAARLEGVGPELLDGDDMALAQAIKGRIGRLVLAEQRLQAAAEVGAPPLLALAVGHATALCSRRRTSLARWT